MSGFNKKSNNSPNNILTEEKKTMSIFYSDTQTRPVSQ